MKPSGAIVLLLSVWVLLGAMCGGRGPTKQERIDAFNEAGWEAFQDGSFTEALEEFSDALKLDSTDVTANMGYAWARIILGHTDLERIALALEKGTSDADWQQDAWCGLAIVRLNQQLYASADSLAALALAPDTSYMFIYYDRIDWRDLLIIQAQARYILTLYTQAWQAVESLLVDTPYESIDPAASPTWVIGTRAYSLFEEIVAVVISALAEQYRQG